MASYHHPLRAGNLAADSIREVASFASGARCRHFIGEFGLIGAWIQGQRLDPDPIVVVGSWRGRMKTLN
jgi:hypothetical protein